MLRAAGATAAFPLGSAFRVAVAGCSSPGASGAPVRRTIASSTVPGIGSGTSCAVTPGGSPVIERSALPLEPLMRVRFTGTSSVLPCSTVTGLAGPDSDMSGSVPEG